MKLSDGLSLRSARNVSKVYSEITYGEHIVDNTCMQLVMNPYQYDVLLLARTSTATSSPICARASSAASGWCRVPTSVTIALSSRQCTVLPLTSPGEASPIPPLSCSPMSSCCATWARPKRPTA